MHVCMHPCTNTSMHPLAHAHIFHICTHALAQTEARVVWHLRHNSCTPWHRSAHWRKFGEVRVVWERFLERKCLGFAPAFFKRRRTHYVRQPQSLPSANVTKTAGAGEHDGRGRVGQVYYVYGFMLLVYLILLVVTVCVAVVGTYFLLNAENYHWQWTSFFSAASTALCVPLLYTLRRLFSPHCERVCVCNGLSAALCYEHTSICAPCH